MSSNSQTETHAAESLRLKDTEPNFDLIHPGEVGWREYQKRLNQGENTPYICAMQFPEVAKTQISRKNFRSLVNVRMTLSSSASRSYRFIILKIS
jgi:hypothetical protein